MSDAQPDQGTGSGVGAAHRKHPASKGALQGSQGAVRKARVERASRGSSVVWTIVKLSGAFAVVIGALAGWTGKLQPIALRYLDLVYGSKSARPDDAAKPVDPPPRKVERTSAAAKKGEEHSAVDSNGMQAPPRPPPNPLNRGRGETTQVPQPPIGHPSSQDGGENTEVFDAVEYRETPVKTPTGKVFFTFHFCADGTCGRAPNMLASATGSEARDVDGKPISRRELEANQALRMRIGSGLYDLRLIGAPQRTTHWRLIPIP